MLVYTLWSEITFSTIDKGWVGSLVYLPHGCRVIFYCFFGVRALPALYLAEIDNAMIEINAEEIPIMDGSAKIFLEIFKNTEIITLAEKRNYFKVLNKIDLEDGGRKISIEPSEDSLEVQFQLNYNNKIIGKQKNTINFNKDDHEEVSSSRTFCLSKDIEEIKKAGLAKGGSLENAIVVDGDKVLNEGGLRNDKEFVNHKILDLVGDFMLSGFRILGKVKCYQGGHELSNKFLRKLFSNSLIKKNIISYNFNTPSPKKIAINA